MGLPIKVSLFGGDGSPGLLKRVLGPPADSLGEALARWVEFRTANVGAILENASDKLGERIDTPGEVPPRVGARILDEGSYSSDPIMVEYLGGVLASARTPVGRDDRGARWTALITSMSAYELRIHYIAYAAARSVYVETVPEVHWGNEFTYSDKSLEICITIPDVARAMDFDDSENGPDILSESLFELVRLGLIKRWQTSSAEFFAQSRKLECDPSGVLTLSPSAAGLQLWMWAQGMGDQWPKWLDAEPTIDNEQLWVPPALLVSVLPPTTDTDTKGVESQTGPSDGS